MKQCRLSRGAGESEMKPGVCVSRLPAIGLVCAMALGQTKPPAEKKYEVVSIKPVAPGAANATGGCGFPTSSFTSPDSFTINHCSLASLIKMAYDADSPWHLAESAEMDLFGAVRSRGQIGVAGEHRGEVCDASAGAGREVQAEVASSRRGNCRSCTCPRRPAASRSRRASREAAFRSIH